MAKKITIANSKGGVGKTTISAMLGYYLSKKGYNVLLVDLDPQSNTTKLISNTFYKEEVPDYKTLYEGLESNDLESSIHKLNDTLDFIASSQNTVDVSTLLNKKNKYTLLKDQIKKFEANYDFIFYDVPPTIFTDFLNNALTASDHFIILTETSNFSFEGINDMYDTALRIHDNVNENLDFMGILVNMREDDEQIISELDKQYDFSNEEMFFKSYIPKRKRIAKYMTSGMFQRKHKSIIEYDRWDNEILNVFEELTKEFLEKIEKD